MKNFMTKQNFIVLLAAASLFAASVAWGSAFVFTKNAFQYLGPFWFLAIRFLLASLVLWIFLFPRLKTLDRTALECGFVVGLPLWGGYAVQTYALQFTTAGNSAFITGTYVVFVPLLGWFITRTIHRKQILIAVFTTIALAVFTLDENFRIAMGDWLTLGCAVLYAIQLLTVDYYKDKIDSLTLTAMSITFAALLHLASALIFEPTPTWDVLTTPDVVIALLFCSVLCTSVALLVQAAAQKVLSVSTASIILTNECLAGAFFGWLLLDEAFPLRKLIGAAGLIICMLFSVTSGQGDLDWNRLKRKKQQTTPQNPTEE